MSASTERDVREALLALHRQLQENAACLAELDCDDPDARALFVAVNNLNELAAQLVVETSLLTPVQTSLPVETR